jgi:hypothetical protein
MKSGDGAEIKKGRLYWWVDDGREVRRVKAKELVTKDVVRVSRPHYNGNLERSVWHNELFSNEEKARARVQKWYKSQREDLKRRLENLKSEEQEELKSFSREKNKARQRRKRAAERRTKK